MTTPQVTDRWSNANDHIAYAAKAINKSDDRKKVLNAIYYGKKRIKTAVEIAKLTGLTPKRVLEVGGKLYASGLVEKDKSLGGMGYRKIDFIYDHLKQILSLAGNREKLKKFPTKVKPVLSVERYQAVSFPSQLIKVHKITIDDIDTFASVRKIKHPSSNAASLSENQIKQGFQNVIGEPGKFTDWGGEKNDLFTTRLRIKGKRFNAAFAFKGTGTRVKKLTPKDMGKNGDQVQRLFQSSADVFIIQYWGDIDESIIHQMNGFAIAASVSQNRPVFYAVIDGLDTARIIDGYKTKF